MSSLFRPESLDAPMRRIEGEVLLWMPAPWKALVLASAGALLVGLGAAAATSFTRKETVSGWIVPDGGLIKMTARQGGVVQAVLVQEGQWVAANAPLARIRLTEQVDGDDAGAEIEHQGDAQLRAVQDQTAANLDRIDIETLGLQQQARDLTRQRQEAEVALATVVARQGLAQADLERTSRLTASGFVSPAYVDAKKAALLAAQRDVSTARSTILALDDRLNDARAKLAAKPRERDAEQTSGWARSAQLGAELTRARADHGYELNSPLAGRVGVLPVAAGQPLAAGATVMTITPAGGRLQAEVFVPSRAAGFIRPGQVVSLRYQAFPYQKFGVAHGHIASVSRTVLSPSDVQMPGAAFAEPVFRVRVTLDREFVDAYGDHIALQPGMLLAADIAVERRTLMEWLLDPLYAVGRRT
ncbi:HlyD family efflux transporter periplasmic adaptor subunit [Caulobacter sp. 1776]|uniref:HlyD family secretion protein n=1 Tax=Caulobacter sp. 1776 TaxID=3156420 RepID=UPI003394C28C